MYNVDYTYIVTGCTGYVGNVLTKKLMENGCRVVGLARSEEKVKRVFGDNAPTVVYGDIRDKETIKKLFDFDGKKVVIHTVAYVSIGEGDKQTLYDVTVGGTQNMLDEAVKSDVVKFLHISSTEALPHKLKLNKDLSNYIPTPKKVKSDYGKAKSHADVAVLKAVKEQGLNASLILLAGVLGPGDYSLSHMTQVMIDYANGKLPASINGGYNDFDIRDVANVLDAIVEKSKSGESYLFAHKPDKINDVLGYVSEVTGSKKLPTLPRWIAYVGLPFLYLGSVFTKKRPLYTLDSLASLGADANFPIDKVKSEFGYEPRPLRETVIDHVNFLRETGMLK